jgi:inosose dehydratase
MPAPETVLPEMAQVGMRGTELGPPGFLSEDPIALAALLARHGLALVGGFVPLVLHEREIDTALVEAERSARLISGAGGKMLVLAAVEDADWSSPQPLDDEGWRRLTAHLAAIESLASQFGMVACLHPHAGTLIETADQVRRALEMVEVACDRSGAAGADRDRAGRQPRVRLDRGAVAVGRLVRLRHALPPLGQRLGSARSGVDRRAAD